MAAENSALPSQVYITFETLKIEEKNQIGYFHNIAVFTDFWLNKCSLDEHKRFFKNIKNLTDPKLLNRKCLWFNRSMIIWMEEIITSM